MLQSCTEIGLLLGRYEGLMSPVPQPQLRRLNRIKTIQGSLAIEGNSLSLDQVTALFGDKKVLGPKKDVLEVTNAIHAYECLKDYKVHSTPSFRAAHKNLMNGLIPDAGKWRQGQVGIFKGSKVSHVAPPAKRVPQLMETLFADRFRIEICLESHGFDAEDLLALEFFSQESRPVFRKLFMTIKRFSLWVSLLICSLSLASLASCTKFVPKSELKLAAHGQLTKAATEGNLALVNETLLNGAYINENLGDADKQITPLLAAIAHGQWDVVDLLLERGASVDSIYSTYTARDIMLLSAPEPTKDKLRKKLGI
jgi:hypothetical protein